MTPITGIAILVACGAPVDEPVSDQRDVQSEEAQFGTSEEALNAACDGTDDSNSLAAGLAVAIAGELGRWDVNTDFVVSNGKLELSPTGQLHCGSGCPRVTALLRLQDDGSSVATNHNPSTYRTKLTTWYGQQKSTLQSLVNQMLHVDEGVYRIRSQLSGKYIVPASGSMSSGAVLQQSDQYASSSAAQWRVVLQGTRQQLINQQSGLCMDLQYNTSGATNFVQRACSGASTQGFMLAEVGPQILSIRTAPLQSLAIANSSTMNNAGIVQAAFNGASAQQFTFEAVGTGSHRDLLETATAVYSLTVSHTGMALAVSSSSLSDGVSVVQQPYSSSDDRFNWYITQVGTGTVNGVPQTQYQFINRRTGKCLDLMGTSTPTALVQRTCSPAQTQRFMLTPTGEGHQVAYTLNGVTMGIQNGSTSSGAPLVEGGKTWQAYNMLALTPIIAGEPHHLSYASSTTNGPCGNYDWYNITQPNGMALQSPGASYVQLIFAGGKQTASGVDINPYIAEQVNGNQVAIDPTYGLDASSTSSTGSCAAACLSVSSVSLTGQCCSCNGLTKVFSKSSFNANTYLCL